MPSNAIILVFWRLSFKIAFLLSSFTFIRGSLFPLYFMPLVRWYRCESWSINKAGCQRIDALQLWCWRKLLRVPWTARRSNQSILKEISPEYSLEGLMLMLKLQHCGHLIWRTNSLEKTLMLGKIEDKRRRGNQGWDGWMASSTQWTWVWANSERRNSVLQPTLKDREPCCAAVHVVTQGWTWLSNWTSSLVAQLIKNLPAMWET